jgi:hypothetical protein
MKLETGHHEVRFEYRSGYSEDDHPDDSYAELSWQSGGISFGANHFTNRSNATGTMDEMSIDVGWLACPTGTGTVHGSEFEAGVIQGSDDLVTALPFSSAFPRTP